MFLKASWAHRVMPIAEGAAMTSRRALLALSLLAVAALTRPVRAPAQEQWVPLLTNVGATVDIDTTSVVRTGSTTIVVWLRMLYDANQLVYDVRREEVDCTRNRTRVVERRSTATERGRQLRIGGVTTPPPDSMWNAYAPGSLGSSVVEAVCRTMRLG